MTDSPTLPPTLAEVVHVLDRLYPPAAAESWDAVGLVTIQNLPDSLVTPAVFDVNAKIIRSLF